MEWIWIALIFYCMIGFGYVAGAIAATGEKAGCIKLFFGVILWPLFLASDVGEYLNRK